MTDDPLAPFLTRPTTHGARLILSCLRNSYEGMPLLLAVLKSGGQSFQHLMAMLRVFVQWMDKSEMRAIRDEAFDSGAVSWFLERKPTGRVLTGAEDREVVEFLLVQCNCEIWDTFEPQYDALRSPDCRGRSPVGVAAHNGRVLAADFIMSVVPAARFETDEVRMRALELLLDYQHPPQRQGVVNINLPDSAQRVQGAARAEEVKKESGGPAADDSEVVAATAVPVAAPAKSPEQERQEDEQKYAGILASASKSSLLCPPQQYSDHANSAVMTVLRNRLRAKDCLPRFTGGLQYSNNNCWWNTCCLGLLAWALMDYRFPPGTATDEQLRNDRTDREPPWLITEEDGVEPYHLSILLKETARFCMAPEAERTAEAERVNIERSLRLRTGLAGHQAAVRTVYDALKKLGQPSEVPHAFYDYLEPKQNDIWESIESVIALQAEGLLSKHSELTRYFKDCQIHQVMRQTCMSCQQTRLMRPESHMHIEVHPLSMEETAADAPGRVVNLQEAVDQRLQQSESLKMSETAVCDNCSLSSPLSEVRTTRENTELFLSPPPAQLRILFKLHGSRVGGVRLQHPMASWSGRVHCPLLLKLSMRDRVSLSQEVIDEQTRVAEVQAKQMNERNPDKPPHQAREQATFRLSEPRDHYFRLIGYTSVYNGTDQNSHFNVVIASRDSNHAYPWERYDSEHYPCGFSEIERHLDRYAGERGVFGRVYGAMYQYVGVRGKDDAVIDALASKQAADDATVRELANKEVKPIADAIFAGWKQAQKAKAAAAASSVAAVTSGAAPSSVRARALLTSLVSRQPALDAAASAALSALPAKQLLHQHGPIPIQHPAHVHLNKLLLTTAPYREHWNPRHATPYARNYVLIDPDSTLPECKECVALLAEQRLAIVISSMRRKGTFLATDKEVARERDLIRVKQQAGESLSKYVDQARAALEQQQPSHGLGSAASGDDTGTDREFARVRAPAPTLGSIGRSSFSDVVAPVIGPDEMERVSQLAARCGLDMTVVRQDSDNPFVSFACASCGFWFYLIGPYFECRCCEQQHQRAPSILPCVRFCVPCYKNAILPHVPRLTHELASWAERQPVETEPSQRRIITEAYWQRQAQWRLDSKHRVLLPGTAHELTDLPHQNGMRHVHPTLIHEAQWKVKGSTAWQWTPEDVKFSERAWVYFKRLKEYEAFVAHEQRQHDNQLRLKRKEREAAEEAAQVARRAEIDADVSAEDKTGTHRVSS